MATNRRAWPTWGWNFGVMPHTYIRNTPSGCMGTTSSSRPVRVEYMRTAMMFVIILRSGSGSEARLRCSGSGALRPPPGALKQIVGAPEEYRRHGKDALAAAEGAQA